MKMMMTGNMKVPKEKKIMEKMKAQCPHCHSIRIRHRDGRDRWQCSIAIFTKLPEELCYPCKMEIKSQTPDTNPHTPDDTSPEVSH